MFVISWSYTPSSLYLLYSGYWMVLKVEFRKKFDTVLPILVRLHFPSLAFTFVYLKHPFTGPYFWSRTIYVSSDKFRPTYASTRKYSILKYLGPFLSGIHFVKSFEYILRYHQFQTGRFCLFGITSTSYKSYLGYYWHEINI